MFNNGEDLASTGANVKIIICFTDGYNFDELKRRLPVDENAVKAASAFGDETDKVSRLISAYLKQKYVGKWSKNSFGKPQSENGFFNISHCIGAVVLAISDSETGVDAEKIRPVKRSLIEYVADKTELPLVANDEDFFKIWTAKESLAKAQGEGLKKDLKQIPALPYDGEKEYLKETYYSRQLRCGDIIITVVKKGKAPFNFDVVFENL